jgi:hypothetical protein
MTTESFLTIESLVETSEGLLVQFKSGERGRLVRANPRYERIRELFRLDQSFGGRLPWPVRVVRSPEGVIENAWPAWRGRPIYVDDVVGPDQCTVCFSLESSPKKVKHDNPNYPRMLETLMLATVEKRDVFYYLEPGEEVVLADVCYADCPPVADLGG